uniref:Uncharacterized protein n=1 Tax=Avena sativa TaxID=4498 RepID=A0ACD5TF96_AVESA
MADMEVTPSSALLESTELKFRNLFMRQLRKGSEVNQREILPNTAVGMGETAVNNWAIYAGPKQDAKLVGHAKGMHISAHGWCHSFSIVFDGEWFTGSTLQAMGVDSEDSDNIPSEWSIVGGTGEFQMARGVINRKFYEWTGDGKTQELTIHAFCVSSFPSAPKEDGPWGGNGSSKGYIERGQLPVRLLSVTVHSGFIVDALEFSCLDQAGQQRTFGPWGGSGGHKDTITLDASDFITRISGTTDEVEGRTVVSSLLIVTNNGKTYGPFGSENAKKQFSSGKVPSNGRITGFFGTYSKYLDSIGVYYA